IKAPREVVYQAFLDLDAVAKWLPPGTMRCQVHECDTREGGRFRMSLTYQDLADSPGGRGGKTSADTDAFDGRFVKLVPNEKIVEAVEFESADAAFAGEMRITWTLRDASGGTEVAVLCENIPRGIRPQVNEIGSRLSLAQLAALVE